MSDLSVHHKWNRDLARLTTTTTTAVSVCLVGFCCQVVDFPPLWVESLLSVLYSLICIDWYLHWPLYPGPFLPDVNECAEGLTRCHPSAGCLNRKGSYECVCSLDYYGDGKTCHGNTCVWWCGVPAVSSGVWVCVESKEIIKLRAHREQQNKTK